MSLTIHLMGRPRVERDGVAFQPKGRKAWALLTYLLLTERSAGRQQLAALLFGEADDPLGALRWNLAELRRLLGQPDALKGEHLVLSLPPGSYVDVQVLTSSTWSEASAVSTLGEELLASMDFPSSPGFEAWLLNERRRIAESSTASLREAALVRLSRGDAESACGLAARLVALEPLDENYQALLIRSYVAAGDQGAAARQLAACIELFRRELGVEPGPSVTSAIGSSVPAWSTHSVDRAASARALLDSGLAALKAGVLDAGIESLSRAASEAGAAGDRPLKMTAMFELGSALVHSGRNRYEQGAAVLHELLSLTDPEEHRSLQAACMSELAWVELLAARYQRCEVWLGQALTLADDDVGESARAHWVLGMALTETGRYAESIHHLTRAIDLADGASDARAGGIARALLGKAHVLRRDLAAARSPLEESLDLFRSRGWTWLLPWPEAYLGELELWAGNLDRARDLLEHSFALASEISDPCFLAKSEANLGLLHAARGKGDEALERLDSARMWLVRTPDHVWTLAYAIDAACAVGVSIGAAGVAAWINDLEVLSGRTGMREYLARSYVHRYNHLGRDPDLDAAVVLAAEVDNPYLHELARTPSLVGI